MERIRQKLLERRVPEATGWKNLTQEADLDFLILDDAAEGRQDCARIPGLMSPTDAEMSGRGGVCENCSEFSHSAQMSRRPEKGVRGPRSLISKMEFYNK